jgi:hypothetical protein
VRGSKFGKFIFYEANTRIVSLIIQWASYIKTRPKKAWERIFRERSPRNFLFYLKDIKKWNSVGNAGRSYFE